MRKLALLIAVLLPLAASAAPPVNMVQNEYDFAAAVAKSGIRDGFLQYLDKQAIIFNPKPENGYDTYAARKPGGTTQLKWYPSYALLASSGDFGVDTGPWVAEWTQDGKPQQAYGQWLTIWSRGADGKWKALFDSGISHNKPAVADKALPATSKVPQLDKLAGPAPAEQDAHDALVQAETAFSNDADKKSLRTAYANAGTDDLRLLLDQSPPMLGKDMAEKVVPDVSAGLNWVPMGGSAARSGDLGYVYGMTYKTADATHQAPQGTYMHVWKRDKSGWKLIIALESPLPADTAK